jgi:hypothetical protein
MLFVVLDGDDILRLPELVRLKLRPRHLHWQLAIPELADATTRGRRWTPIHSVRSCSTLTTQTRHAIQHVGPCAWPHCTQFPRVAKMSHPAVATALEAAERRRRAQRAINSDYRSQARGQPLKAHVQSLRTKTRHANGVNELPISDEPNHHLDASTARNPDRESTYRIRTSTRDARVDNHFGLAKRSSG